MEEDTPTADPTLFPFELTIEQAQTLNNLMTEQWMKHCQNVHFSHLQTEPEIDRFLSLPIKEIVRIFRGTVEHLVASSTPPTDPPTPTLTPSTSTSSPTSPITLPTMDIPPCGIQFTPDQIKQYGAYTDKQFLNMARVLKEKPNRKKGPVKTFLTAYPINLITASIKQSIQ